MASVSSFSNFGFLEFNTVSKKNISTNNYACHSSINCILGPDNIESDFIESLIEIGVSSIIIDFRNKDWTIEKARDFVQLARKLIIKISSQKSYYIPVPIGVSLIGSHFVCGRFLGEKEDITVSRGEYIFLTTLDEYNYKGTYYPAIYISDSSLHTKIKISKTKIVFDYGDLILEVLEILSINDPFLKDDKAIKCVALNNAVLSDYTIIYLSTEEELEKGTLNREDKQILKFCIEMQIDSIFVPALRHCRTIQLIKNILASHNDDYHPLFVACICDTYALKELGEIIDYADGICFSRKTAMKYSDEGEVLFIQKLLNLRCLNSPTFLLISDPLPDLDFEIPSDQHIPFFNAIHYVLEGLDGVVIDQDFIKSPCVLAHLNTLQNIMRMAESYHWKKFDLDKFSITNKMTSDLYEALTISSITLYFNIGAKAIFLLTVSGKTAKIFYKYRPPVKVFAITRSKIIGRQLTYYNGITPLIFSKPCIENWCEDVDTRFKSAIKCAKSYNRVEAGDTVILLSGWLPGSGNTNRIRILTVE